MTTPWFSHELSTTDIQWSCLDESQVLQTLQRLLLWDFAQETVRSYLHSTGQCQKTSQSRIIIKMASVWPLCSKHRPAASTSMSLPACACHSTKKQPRFYEIDIPLCRDHRTSSHPLVLPTPCHISGWFLENEQNSRLQPLE